MVESLKACPQLTSRTANVKIFPLHSSLSSQEQNQVFQPVPAGWRKIVVSTNIAETSVTIEDVVYVIDTCRVKENSYDEVCFCCNFFLVLKNACITFEAVMSANLKSISFSYLKTFIFCLSTR